MDNEVEATDNNRNLWERITGKISPVRKNSSNLHLEKNQIEEKLIQKNNKLRNNNSDITRIVNLLVEIKQKIKQSKVSFNSDIMFSVDNLFAERDSQAQVIYGSLTVKDLILEIETVLNKIINPKAEDYIINLDS